LKLYFRTIAVKTAWYWYKNRHEDHWNRIKDPDTDPRSYTPLIFDKNAKNHTMEKTVSSKNISGKVVIHLQKTETTSMPVSLC
jgi:hypothetical protein